MKKAISILLSVAIMVVCLTGCAGTEDETPSEPVIKVNGAAFDCTPQELINLINKGLDDNDDIYLLPNDDGSVLDKKISSGSLTVSYLSNDDGKLVSLEIYWASGSGKKVETSAGYYCGALIGLLAPAEADKIHDEIESAMEDREFLFYTKAEGVSFGYGAVGTRGNRFSIGVA